MNAKVGLAIGLCAAMLLAGFAVQSVKAADVENQWLIEIPGAPPTATFMDVAWSDDGQVAVFAGYEGMNAITYLYFPENNTWYKSDNTLVNPSTALFRTIEYLPSSFNGPMFLMFGSSGSAGDFYSLQPQFNNTIYWSNNPSLINTEIYGSCVDSMWRRVIVAGTKTTVGAYAVAYNYTTAAWTAVNTNGNASLNMIWYDAAIIANNDVPDVALVGANKFNSNNLYNIVNFTTGMTLNKSSPGLQAALTDITYDSLNYRAIITTAMRGGDLTGPGLYAVDKAAGFQNLHPVGYNISRMEDLWGIDMTNGRAIAVGNNTTSGNGIVYDVVASGTSINMFRQSNTSAPFVGKNFTGVAIRPQGIPMAMLSGSAFKYSYINSNGNIIVNTIYPHIRELEMVHTTNLVSVLNSNVNVDPGDNSNWYNISVQGFMPAAAGASGALDYFELSLWHDGGATGADNSGSVGVAGENVGLHMWSDGTTFFMDYPTTGEWTLIGAGGAIDREGGGLGTNFSVSFFFRPNQQVRNGTGDGAWSAGINPGGAPGRFWDSDGVEDQGNPATALDDAFSWDIKFVVADNTSAASASAYDEFGISRFVFLGNGASLPGGGQLAGSGAPGQTVTLAPSATEVVVFNSNCWFDLRVWSTDLAPGVPVNGPITADNLNVQGGQLGVPTPIAGAGEPNALYLLGGAGGGVWEPMLNAGTQTTTMTATGGGAFFVMTCDIPLGKAEDTYTGVMTYSITTNP
ncbi:MAG: hypothetical protein HZB92_00570 [Euryarchaeota archaeon]|nr:hypothetical protein [Euryarchaeota archaeon]